MKTTLPYQQQTKRPCEVLELYTINHMRYH